MKSEKLPNNKFKPSPQKFKPSPQIEPSEILGSLLNATTENRVTIADTVEKLLITRVKTSNESDALVALEIGLHLDLFSRRPTRERSWRSEEIDFWRSASARIFEECVYHIEVLCEQSLRLCFDAFWRGKVSIRNFTKWHGVESLFRKWGYTFLRNTRTSDLATTLIISVLFPPPQPKLMERWENNLHHVEEIGHVLFSSPPPWFTTLHLQPYGYSSRDFVSRLDFYINQHKEKNQRKIFRINSSTLFGAFTLLAAILEVCEKQELGTSLTKIKQLREIKIPLFDSIYWTFLSRFNPVKMGKVQAELDRCSFTPEQQALAWQWVRREINFVE